VGFISISDVEVTRDLAHAKIFVTVFESEKAASSIEALQQKAPFLRHRLSQEMRLRSVPELHFHHDSSVENGLRMDGLIRSALESDRSSPDAEDETER